MRSAYQIAGTIAALVVLSAVPSTARLDAERATTVTHVGTVRDGNPPESTVDQASIVVDNREVEGVLGKEVRSVANENIGRIVEVIVDRGGQVRAAVIDFGGFLGVGSRKIAVDWNKLRFTSSNDDQRGRIVLELTKDQMRAAPEYKDGKPVVILGALDPRVPYSAAPEW
jgi:hypothetical protein